MKKNILKLIILTLIFLPSISKAVEDPNRNRNNTSAPAGYVFCSNENQTCNFTTKKDVAYGAVGHFNYKYGISGGINCTNNVFGDPYQNTVKSCYIKDSIDTKTNIFVQTEKESNVTYTTATLNGTGGYITPNNTLSPLTAYFRYSNAKNSPIFCNDIYGTNMIATRDIKLGIVEISSFSQEINNLTPDTTYYYCAIISNRENIVYGGESIVKQFHTNPNKTSIKTSSATAITSTTATLNGYYSAVENVTTSFQYKKTNADATVDWNNICEKTYTKGKNVANIYGELTCNIPTKLDPNTKYQFRAVAKNNSGTEKKIFYGATFNLITNSNDTGNTGGSDNTGDGNDGGTTTTTKTPTITTTSPTGTTVTTTNTTNPPGTWVNNDTGGKSGTWGNSTGSGTWVATSGTGGGIATWTGTGNGTGTWQSATGSGTWTNGLGGGGAGTGTWDKSLKLGQKTTPPDLAIVRYHEGIETVFVRQIMANQNLAITYGYEDGINLQSFAWTLADNLAKMFGYVNKDGKEIRVSFPDIAAYQLLLVGDKLTVYEYYDNKIIDIRNLNTTFKNASDYEYYWKKNK